MDTAAPTLYHRILDDLPFLVMVAERVGLTNQHRVFRMQHNAYIADTDWQYAQGLTHHADDLSRIESHLAADELAYHVDHERHHLVLDLLIELPERPVEHGDDLVESLDPLPDLRPPLLEPFTVAIGLALPAALFEALAMCGPLYLVELRGRQQATGLLDRRFTLPLYMRGLPLRHLDIFRPEDLHAALLAFIHLDELFAAAAAEIDLTGVGQPAGDREDLLLRILDIAELGRRRRLQIIFEHFRRTRRHVAEDLFP